MTLKIALVIAGDNTGAKTALEGTATGIGNVGGAAREAAGPMGQVSEKLGSTAPEAARASAELPKVANAAKDAGDKFESMKSFAIGALGGIAAGFVTAGLGAAIELASGSFTNFVRNIVDSGPQIQAALEQQAQMIGMLKSAMEEAGGGPSSYGALSTDRLVYSAQQNILTQQAALARVQEEALTGGAMGLVLGNAPGLARFGLNDPTVGQGSEGTAFEEPVKRFRQQLQEGTADAVAFQQEVLAIAKQLPEDDNAGRSLADQILGDSDAIVAAQTELKRAVGIYQGLGGDVTALETALGKSNGALIASGQAAGQALPNMEAFAKLAERIGQIEYSALPGGGIIGPQTYGGGFKDGGRTGFFSFSFLEVAPL